MALASVAVCVDLVANPAAAVAPPCPSGQGLMVVQAYLPEPSSAFDSVQASGFFFFGFGVVIFAYLLGFAVHQVRKPVLRGSS